MQEGNFFLPWYNFSLLNFLQGFLKPKMKIFEFGCGFSTLFYAQKKCKVVAFETRAEWIEKIESLGVENNLKENFEIHQCKANDLPKTIFSKKHDFNVIVVDSYHRMECLKNAMQCYTKGIIILDNSERKNLRLAKKTMEGFLWQEFKGKGVARDGESVATVFWKNL